MKRGEPDMARTAAEAEAQELSVPEFSAGDDEHVWMDFAHTLNGYGIAEDLGIDLGELANTMRDRYRETGELHGSLLELRLMLFYLAREMHMMGPPEPDDPRRLALIQGLIQAISATIKRRR